MPIPKFKNLTNSFLFSNYSKYDYKFGDLDLMNSGGLLGNSAMNFGLFYQEIEQDNDGSARFKFKDLSTQETMNEQE